MKEILQPPGWPRPKGYSNGIAATGRMIFTSGQIGWDEEERIVSPDLAEQVRKTLENTLVVLKAAGAEAEHIVRMTWYITDRQAYVDARPQIGEAYRSVLGKVFPAMSVIFVASLLEEGAKVEIETTAVIPEQR